MEKYPNLFSPIEIGGKKLRNRLAASPNIILRCREDDPLQPIDDFYGFLTQKAMGVGEVLVGDFPVDVEIAPFERELFTYDEATIAEMAKTAEAIHKGGATASIEIISAGAVARPPIIKRMLGWKSFIGPSGFTRPDGVEIAEMDEDMIEKTIENSARVAEAFQKAGFDAILIHGAHSWLINQFFSPLLNHRTDRWGGSFENRSRYPIAIIDRIREKVGKDFIIQYRINGSDCHEGGNTTQDIIRFLRQVEDKIDLIHVSAGALGIPGEPKGTNTSFDPYAPNAIFSEQIKKSGIKTPVIVVGSILDADTAEALIKEGKTDMVAMGRAFVTTPDFPQKILEGREDEIIPCMRCFYCMNGELPDATEEELHFQCAANPITGRFPDPRFTQPAEVSKKVLVAGGGPAGMQAAITLSARGHSVILAEAAGELGGIIRFTDKDSVKRDIKNFKDSLIRRVKKSGCELRLNTAVTPALIREIGPDAVIAAVGSLPGVPPIPGIEKAVHALGVYEEGVEIGKEVVLVGGGLAGCETAVHLGRLGHRVTVVEMSGTYAADANIEYGGGLERAMEETGVTVLTNARCREIRDEGVVVALPGGEEKLLRADSVVYALGMKPKSGLVEELKAAGVPVVAVGDCVQPKKIKDAVHTAFFASLEV